MSTDHFDICPLKMGPPHYPHMSGTNHAGMQHNITEEWIPQLHLCERLKTANTQVCQ
jgi:hypothetical protein